MDSVAVPALVARHLLFAAFALAACALHAQPLPAEVRAALFAPTQRVEVPRGRRQVPMRGTDWNGAYKCPYFQVYVNGKGPFTFLYDTGAAYTIVSSKVAYAAGARVEFDRKGRRDVVRLDEVDVSGVKLRDVLAIRDDDWDVDGVLGFPAFGPLNVLIDFAARTMTLGGKPSRLPRSFELPFEAPLNVPTIPIRIGERELRVLIDTGDDAYAAEFLETDLAGAKFTHPPVTADQVMNGATVQETKATTLAEPLWLGPMKSTNPEVIVNNGLPVSDIGYALLRQFRFEIQPGRRVVQFQPLVKTMAIETEPRAGFSFRFDGSYRVTRIAAGTEAAAAEMQVGDEIVAIDHQPARRFDRQAWDRLVSAGKPFSVTWEHSGASHDTTITPTRVR